MKETGNMNNYDELSKEISDVFAELNEIPNKASSQYQIIHRLLVNLYELKLKHLEIMGGLEELREKKDDIGAE